MNKSLLLIALIFVSASIYAKPKQKTLTAEEQLMAAMSKAFSGKTNPLNQLQAKKEHSGSGFVSNDGQLTIKNKKGLTPVSPSVKSAK